MRAVSSIFFITLRSPYLENIFLSNVLNLRVLRHTMTTSNKYPVQDCDNILSLIQMQLLLKSKTFSPFFLPSQETKSNFKHFKKKMIATATLFRKLNTVRELVKPLFKKHRFRTTFDSQHIKGSQTLVKSASEHFDQIFPSLWETLILKISPLVIC